MESVQDRWKTGTMTTACRVVMGSIALIKKRYQGLKTRYGPRYTKIMLGTCLGQSLLASAWSYSASRRLSGAHRRNPAFGTSSSWWLARRYCGSGRRLAGAYPGLDNQPLALVAASKVDWEKALCLSGVNLS